jgi:hypothetical protein
MNKIMAELNKKFAGQSAARLTTYAGKMDLLAAAAANSQEIIGKGLLDALTALGNDKSIENITIGMENFATAISEVIVGLGEVGSKLKGLGNLPGGGSIFDVRNIPVIGAYIGGLRQIGRNAMPQQDRGGMERTAGRVNAQEIRITNKLAKARAEEFRLLGVKNNIENKNVEELKKKFDLERIGLSAALNSATDEETKLRVRAQMAILDNNEALAKKLLAEMEAAEALKKLAEQARLAGMSLEDFALFKVKTLNIKIDDYLQNTALEMVRSLNAQIARFIAALGGVKTSAGGGGSGATYDYALAEVKAKNEQIKAFEYNLGMESTRELNSRINEFLTQNASTSGSTNINLTVDTSQTGDRFAQLIAESIQVATKSGISYSIAGGL